MRVEIFYTSLTAKEFLTISLPSLILLTSFDEIAWPKILPTAVPSVGPASTLLPVNSFVSLFKYSSLLPPPTILIVSNFWFVTSSICSIVCL